MNAEAHPVSVTEVRRTSTIAGAGVSRGASPLAARTLSEKALTRSAWETGAGSGIIKPSSDLPRRTRSPTLLAIPNGSAV